MAGGIPQESKTKSTRKDLTKPASVRMSLNYRQGGPAINVPIRATLSIWRRWSWLRTSIRGDSVDFLDLSASGFHPFERFDPDVV